MADSSTCFFTSTLHCPSPLPPLYLSPPNIHGDSLSNRSTQRRRVCGRRRRGGSPCSFVALSAHSNPRILKSTRNSRYRRNLPPYDSDEEDADAGDDENGDDGRLSDDDFAQMGKMGPEQKGFELQADGFMRQGSHRQMKGGWRKRLLRSGRSLQIAEGLLNVNSRENSPGKVNVGNSFRPSDRQKVGGFADKDVGRKMMARKSTENRIYKLSEELDLDEKWFPLLDYLSTYGLKKSHLIQMYERHMSSLRINVVSARGRLEYLLSVGVKQRDIKRILLRQPQILEYTVENTLKSHISFLVDIGIPHSKLGQIISAAPSLFSYSVENSLKPTVRYLVEEVGIKKNDVGKVVQLSPQILVQRIDNSWNSRYTFFSKELGAPRDTIVRMITKHPQLLHYSIEEGLLPRINFLRSIGLHNTDILKVLARLTQVLSLSLEENLKPKYMYLINELRNEVQSLTKYPMYLSLSLDQRIRPRHRFLVSLNRAPKGPFPLSSFVPTDECFCQQWAGTSLDNYLAFRQSLLLKDFAQKYERQR